MDRALLKHLIDWALVSPLLFLALACHVLTQFVGISFIRQCLATGTFKRTSGLPLVGPILLVLSFTFTRAWPVLYLAGTLLALEILLGIAANRVMRKTNARPESP